MTNRTINDGYPAPGGEMGSPIESHPWPVLARIPWVVTQHDAQAEPLPSYAAMETQADVHASPLQLAEPTPGRLRYELPIAAERPTRHGRLEGRTFIDQPHLAVRGYDWQAEPSAAVMATSAPAVYQGASEQAILRIDRGSAFAGTEKSSPASQQTFAAKVFQVHAAVAPHAGIVMTAAMAISVAVLCWLTMGRWPDASSYEDALQAPGNWQTETATHALPVNPAPALGPLNGGHDLEFAWRVTPPLEPKEKADPPAEASPDESSKGPVAAAINDAAAVAAPELTLADSPGATPAASVEGAAAEAPVAPIVESAPEPITPTPTATAFPTTPYGEFDYMAVRPDDAPAEIAPSR